ncbi:MAG TPA: hypothetical protein VL099_13940 [Candidatus Binatia bacterium]|nr:hypothetical protein [Candidatus Binatia bacterium]
MTARGLARPNRVSVNRTELRQRQRKTLEKAKGTTVVVIRAAEPEQEKLLLDKQYFDELVGKIGSLAETLEITMDRRLFEQILRTAPKLEEKTRAGRLHSFEEAFGKG